MAEFENEDVLLLQDDENDIETNEADGYDFQHLYVADEIKNVELNRKTRGSLNKPSKKPSRIIKGTAITSDKAPKPVKRKAKSTSATSKATKSPRVEDFSPEELSVLRDKMGISTMGKSIDTLTHLFRGFINKCGKEPVRTPRCETVSRSSNQAEVVENPTAVSSNSPILPLEANLDAVHDFDLDYLDDPVYVPPSGVCARADDSPAPVDFETSFDPALGFSDAFRAPLSEINVPVSQPVVEQVEQYDFDFAWEIPQLNTEEKTGPKISSSLSKAVNAAMSVKSNQDSIKLIEERYLRPENCENLCVPRVNKEIWTALPRQAHTVDSKMQETQRYFVKGLTPIVQLANHCCKNEPLDVDNTRKLLSDSICLLGHGFLSLTQRRRSALRPYLNDKFKPICNSDVPVDSSLFGADCMKQMKELGDYTKIPIANPRFLGRGSRSNNNSAPSSYSRDQYLSLNSRGPVGRQGGRQFPSLRGRGRGFPTGNRGSQRGHNSQRGFYQNNHFRQ
ncbi:uncharacterized protein LOC127722290 [Mytilus californianus]|uniref:uncharacterized protein LOC127722290 n=1 Tax=Mytilus californianus TaxID=6549 RepID=UPI0022480EB4|nr:uncharacterized protein LOC127722290 [Mytilus californianus]